MDPPLDHPPDIVVELSNTQTTLRLDPDALAATVRAVLGGEGVRAAEVSLALVDDATIHAINRRHLDHDWPTDVITFTLSERGDAVLAAELVVSAEMAARTAAAAGTDPLGELTLYVVHGLLHLCGFDDRTADDALAMRRRESEVLAGLGLPDVFGRTGPAPAPAREEAPCSR